jgi:L-alanine-DL-glutamate epimerase-like enolase superfamily enzyme
MTAPRLTVHDIALFERPVPFARPFRFGAVTVGAAAQAFVRADIEVEGHGRARGVAAEMLVPKWFDKRPERTPAQTIDDLRASLAHAAQLYRASGARDTAFGHHARAYAAQQSWASGQQLPMLAANYGPAVVDKAILDALLKALQLDLGGGLRANAAGLDTRLAPDLSDRSLRSFLARIAPLPAVAVRHTVGLVDELEGADGLASAIERARLTHFKIKIGGDVPADLERLRALAALLSRSAPGFRATLDANEQYDRQRLSELIVALQADPRLSALRAGLLYIEQPIDRRATWDAPLAAYGDLAFIIDEADDSYEAFPRARALGYRGVSSKTCKGLYKSVLNAARAAAWTDETGAPGRAFVTGEDLTCPAGLAVQQDTALVAALGIGHVERNGHHYVDGFGVAPAAEAQAFLAAHPGFYRRDGDHVRLDVGSGRLATPTLFRPGFASGAEPDWAKLAPLGPRVPHKETTP